MVYGLTTLTTSLGLIKKSFRFFAYSLKFTTTTEATTGTAEATTRLEKSQGDFCLGLSKMRSILAY